MVECIIMLVGIVFSVISLLKMKPMGRMKKKYCEKYVMAYNRSFKYLLELAITGILMIGCLIVHFVVFTWTTFYICLAVYIGAIILFQVVRNKQYLFFDFDNRQMILPKDTKPFDKVMIDEYSCQAQIYGSTIHIGCSSNDFRFAVMINNADDFNQIKALLLEKSAADITVQTVNQSRRMVRILIGIGAILFLVGFSFLLSDSGRNGSEEEVDYHMIYHKEVLKNQKPETICQLEDGTICALFMNYGFVNMYDEQGKYEYTYKVPKESDRCSFEMATDGKYLILVNWNEESFVYCGEQFVEKLKKNQALLKYDADIVEEYTNEKLIAYIRPDVNDRYGYIFISMVLIGLLCMCIGRRFYVRTEIEFLQERLQLFT